MDRRWKVLLVTSLAGFMTFLDATIVNVAFPSIQRSFPATSREGLSWVLSAYAIVFAALLVTAGRAADILGRRRIFFAGLGVFTLASVAGGLAPSVETLVAARALQAAGAAMLVPSALALLLPEFPLSERSTAVGVWGAVAAVAAATGPSAGSALIEWAGWRSVFFVNVPVGLLAWLTGRSLLDESKDPAAERRLDWLGVVLAGTAMAGLALGIVQGRQWGWTDARILASFGTAAVLLPIFLVHSAHHASPILDLALFRVRTFAVANGATVVFSAAFFASLLNNVLYLTGVWQYSVLGAGLAITPAPIAAAIVAGPAGRIADRRGHRIVVVPGAIVYAVANLWFATRVGTAPAFTTRWLPGAILLGIGVGLTFPTLGSAAATSLPPARFAVGSAVIATARQLGAVIGVAALIAVLGVPAAREAAAAYDRSWIFIAVTALASGALSLALGRGPQESDERGGVRTMARDKIRKRTVTWEDPMIGARAALSLSGVEYLRSIGSGDIPPPPIAALLGFDPAPKIDEGAVVFSVEPAEYHYNPIGLVHGGLASALFDAALGSAVHTTLPAGVGYTTLELKVNFLRPITLDTGRVRCEAEVIHVGRRIATAQGRLVDAKGKLLAHATSTCLILRPPQESLLAPVSVTFEPEDVGQ